MPTYLQELTIRLSAGLGRLPEEVREKQANYFKSGQRDDGGFGGREGDSDIYYTGFALRGLAILGELYGPVAERAAEFLRGRLTGRESIVDFLSLIYGSALLDSAAGIDIFSGAQSDWRTSVASAMEQLRRDDGGYAKGPEGRASSTYHTFLVILCLQLMDAPVNEPDRVIQFLKSQAAEGGGFREIRAGKRAGTNPTAAAIGSLRILDALDDEICEDTIDFLCEMQNDEGGLRANTRIPIADLLSTFTGALTLADLNALEEIDLSMMRRFVESLQLEEGGFHAAAWDLAHDVEYTFYGLGNLALLKEFEDEGQTQDTDA
jgi:geranylgeranyl transferase type-2 subunit beta